jgi:predicted ATP-grasp superfamily ATP-dependent carboligase
MSRIWAIGASVRALAQNLVAAGHEVVAADLFNDVDLQHIACRTQRIVNYPYDLLRLVDEVEADAFIYTGGLENAPDLIDALARRLPLLGNPGRIVQRVRDVPTLRQALERSGFQMPPMAQSVSTTTRTRWLRKAADSSGGLRVGWAEKNQAPLRPGEYFQAFIDGPVYGASFLGETGGAQLLGIARQFTDSPWTNAPQFHYAGSLGPVYLPDGMQRQVRDLGQLLVSEFELQGWFGIDFVVDFVCGGQQRLWVLEVNPRYTASMELLEHAAPVSGKAILYADRRIHVAPAFVERLQKRDDVADIPRAGSELPAASPVLSCFARGDSEAAVLKQLQDKSSAWQAAIGELANSPASVA